MKRSKYFREAALLFSLLAFAIVIGSEKAAGEDRFDQGAEQCSARYLDHANEAMRLKAEGDLEGVQISERLAEQNLRCARRFESAPALSKKEKREKIKFKLAAARRRLKKLKKKRRKAEKKVQLAALAKVNLKILNLQEKINRLQDQLKGANKCTDKSSGFTLELQNNSSYNLGVFLVHPNNDLVNVDVVFSVSVNRVKLSLEKLFPFSDNQNIVRVALKATINGQDVFRLIKLDLGDLPTKRPCVIRQIFELFDNTFPAPDPKENYGVYVLEDDHTCCNLGNDTYPYVYHAGAVDDWPTDAIPVQTGFDDMEELREWVCKHTVVFHYWAGNQTVLNGFTVTKVPCSID